MNSRRRQQTISHFHWRKIQKRHMHTHTHSPPKMPWSRSQRSHTSTGKTCGRVCVCVLSGKRTNRQTKMYIRIAIPLGVYAGNEIRPRVRHSGGARRRDYFHEWRHYWRAMYLICISSAKQSGVHTDMSVLGALRASVCVCCASLETFYGAAD